MPRERFLFRVAVVQALTNRTIRCGPADNFRPESVDSSKPGVVEVKQGKGATMLQVERASVQVRASFRCTRLTALTNLLPGPQSDEVHTFRGKEEPAKDVECILIYDEETGVRVIASPHSYPS